jgi:hypothetical protein
MVFQSEAHLNKAKAEKMMHRFGFHHFLVHESDGRSGGLLVMLKKDV